MHFSTVFALALALVGVFGWAQAADGRWIANNKFYPQVSAGKFIPTTTPVSDSADSCPVPSTQERP